MSSTRNRIYLDNAATSWPKLPAAVEAATSFITECGATAGRGSYSSAQVAERWLVDARTQISRLLGGNSGSDIAFCNSGTHALNAALWGFLRPGDHVITTAMEHNSVLRPLQAYKELLSLEIDVVDADSDGRANATQALAHCNEKTKLFAIGHASNVTGSMNDLTAWREAADKAGALLLVDASQTLGYQPINVEQPKLDILVAAGHKGLRALPGTGLIYVARQLQPQMRALMFGGTGTASESLAAGQAWPQAVEVGNLNLPGIVSMGVAAKHLLGDRSALAQWKPAFERLANGLCSIDGIQPIGLGNNLDLSMRIPVVSTRVRDWEPHDMAAVLDEFHAIEVRSGLHCAALIHNFVGSNHSGGTLRLSPGHSTTLQEVDATIAAFAQIISGE